MCLIQTPISPCLGTKLRMDPMRLFSSVSLHKGVGVSKVWPCHQETGRVRAELRLTAGRYQEFTLAAGKTLSPRARWPIYKNKVRRRGDLVVQNL